MNKKILIALAAAVVVALIGAGTYRFVTGQSGEDIPLPELTWHQAKKMVRPQLVPSLNKTQVPIANIKLTEKVDVAFVIDRTETYDFIMKGDLPRWDVSVEELYERAVRNLDKAVKISDFEMGDVGEGEVTSRYITFENDDIYTAARILLPSIRKQMSKLLTEPYIAGIPTRDFLILWSHNLPLYEDFAKQVQEEYMAEESHRLTNELFRITGDTLEVSVSE